METTPSPCPCAARVSVLEERLLSLTRSVDKAEVEIKEKVLHGNALREEMRIQLTEIRAGFVGHKELEAMRQVSRIEREGQIERMRAEMNGAIGALVASIRWNLALLVPTMIGLVTTVIALVALYFSVRQVWVR